MSNINGYIYQRLRELGLSESASRDVYRKVKIQSYNQEAIIWVKGSAICTLNFVISGLVAAAIPCKLSRIMPVSIYGEKSWFGEQSIINEKVSYADYICLLQTDLMCIPAADVIRLMEIEIGFSMKMAKIISWRAQRTSEMLMIMRLGSPCLRVVTGICQFAEALAYNSTRPPTIGFGEGLVIPVKQDVIASMCGVSRTIFSERVQRLSSEGWLRVSYGKIELLSLNSWLKLAALQRTKKFENLNSSLEELLGELGRYEGLGLPSLQ